MTLLIIFEILKIVGWATVLWMTIYYRKYIRIDFFWLKVMASVLMTLGGLTDIWNYHVLQEKSLLWFFGNVFIIALYLYMTRIDVKTKRHITNLHEKIDNDFNEILNEIKLKDEDKQ